MPSAAAQLPDDPAALKAMIAALRAENAKVEETIARLKASLRAHEALVQALRLRIARLKKQRFGQSSEKIAREIEQLELALENLEVSQAGSEAEMPPAEDDEVTAPGAEGKTVPAPPQAAGGGRDAARAHRARSRRELPRMRRRPAADRGGCQRDSRPDRRQAEGGRDGPAEEVLPPLRAHHPTAGAVAPDPARHGGTGAACLYPGRQVRRSSAALSPAGDLYDIEAEITGQSAETRRAARQARSKPKVQAFKAWAEDQLKRIPGKSDLAKAFRYGLNRWESFCLFLDDGRVAIDNNPAERKMKPIALGRRNFLFVGSDAGGETLADAMTIIETAKDNGLDPQAYLADIFARINDHKINRIDELLPWNWAPMGTVKVEAA